MFSSICWWDRPEDKICFRNPKRYCICRVLYNHFHGGVWENASYTVHILEKIDGNGRTVRGALDGSIRSKRKQKGKGKRIDIKSKNSLPLNDWLGDDFVKENTYILIGPKFSALPRKLTRISRGRFLKLLFLQMHFYINAIFIFKISFLILLISKE